MSLHCAMQAPTAIPRLVSRYCCGTGGMENHLKTSAKKECDKPNDKIAIVVPARQVKRTGLRPTWSESRFHWNAVAASVA